MKSLIGLIVPSLALALASGCGGAAVEKPTGVPAALASSGSVVAPGGDAALSAASMEPKIPVNAKTRPGPDSGFYQDPARFETILGVPLGEIERRTSRATSLLEVSIGKNPNIIRRTGTAFCVSTTGLFVTHSDVVKDVTEARGQVRMLFGDRLEPRIVVYPRIVRVDDETNLASLQIDQNPELSLEALSPAKSVDLSAGAKVVVLGFPWGRHYERRDAQGKPIEVPRFELSYWYPTGRVGGWGKEPPDHFIFPVEVRNVWRENGRVATFDFPEGGHFFHCSSGAPVLNAAGEVVGIVTRTEPPDTIKLGVGADYREYTPAHPVNAVVGFHGALSAERLSRFLEGERRKGDVAQNRPEADQFAVLGKGKKATAFVEVSTRAGECSGTAFCVDKSGLFITNAHVIIDATKDSRYVVSLVMDIGLPTQRVRRAEIVRIDEKVDLALVKIDGESGLEALELGVDGDLSPTMRVTTFGFPFGRLLAAASSAYPEVAVNSSRVTAVGLEVRFDGQLNPGNSGGPVLDSRGRVVGVASATILGASINFAIPVGKLRGFLATPGLRVRTSQVAFRDRARPTTWTIQVVPSAFAPLPDDLAVSATIPGGANPPRRLWAEPVPGGAAGSFRLEFVPMPRDLGRALALAVRLNDHTRAAVVEDQDVTIGGRKLRLGAVRHLVLRPNPWAYVTDEPVSKGPIVGPGQVVKGPITGLGKVAALEGAKHTTIDLGAATEFSVVEVGPVLAAAVAAVIEVRKGGKDGTLVCGGRTRMRFEDEKRSRTVAQTETSAPAPAFVPQAIEKHLTLLTRTMPRNPRTARLRLDDKDGRFQIGGELDVTGAPKGATKAIRPPRVAIPMALSSRASEAGLGTRELDVPAPPSKAEPGMAPGFTSRPNVDPPILAVCFSRDGSRLAMSLQESIRIHDVASGRLIKELDQPHATQIAFTANQAKLWAFSAGYTEFGRRNVTVPPRGPVVWDLKTGTSISPPPVPKLENQGPVEWISPESRFVLTRGTGLKCWDVRTGAMALALPEDPRLPFAVQTADGRNLPNPVVTADGKRLLSFYGQPREAPPRAAAAQARGRAAPAPAQGETAAPSNGPWVARSLRLHDIETGRLLFEMDFAGMTFLGLVPGSNACVCEAADGTISFRDLKTGRELRRVTLRPNSPPKKSSPFEKSQPPSPQKPYLTPDGKRLVKPIWQGGFGLFDLDSGDETARFKTSEATDFWPSETLTLAPTGRLAAVYPGRGQARRLHLWTFPSPAASPSQATARKPEPPLVRELAGTATAVAVGGAGRYLLLTLADARQLVVFDVNSAEVVKQVPLDSKNALVAAGASKFVIAYPDTKRIERWNFSNLTRDIDPRAVPVDGTLEAIAMGADSEGPLLASWWFPHMNPTVKDVKNNRFSFIDLTSFKVLAVGLIALLGHNDGAARLAASGGDFEFSYGGWVGKTRIRASYDGSLFGICRADVDRSAAEVALKVEAAAITVSHDDVPLQHATPIYMIPSPDGQRVFHGRTGVRGAVFLESPVQDRLKRRLDEESPLRLPTTDPRFDISLRAADTITLLSARDGTRLLTVAGLDEMTDALQPGDIVRDGISLENRYHLVPAAKLLVTIPPTNDRLVLRRLEIDPASAR